MGILVLTSLPSTLKKMKGFIIFALLIVGVYSAQLREIRLNIKRHTGCQGRDLKIRITQDDEVCETTSSGRFGPGQTIVWEPSYRALNPLDVEFFYGDGELGACSDFDFDDDAEFNLVYNGNGRYCPTMIEFLTRRNGSNSLASFKSKLDRPGQGHWFSSADNDREFEPLSNTQYIASLGRVQCPERQQGCPVNQLQAYRQVGRAREQCIFECPRIQKIEGNGQEMIVGQRCYEVTYQVEQYEYCCRSDSMETGFERCQDVRRPNRENNYGQSGQNGHGQNVQCQNGYCQTENGYGQNGNRQNGYGQNGYGQNGYGQNGYGQNGYGQNGYGQNGYGQNGYGQNGYQQNGYVQTGYGQTGYGQNEHVQTGYGQTGHGQVYVQATQPPQPVYVQNGHEQNGHGP